MRCGAHLVNLVGEQLQGTSDCERLAMKRNAFAATDVFAGTVSEACLFVLARAKP